MHGVTSLLGGLSLSSRPALPAPLSVRLARCAAAPRPAFVVFAAASDSAPSGPEPEATAALRSLKGSAFKVRRVLDVIRGRDYEDTLMILEFLPQRCSEHIQGLVMSCAANAKNNLKMAKSKLFVSEAFANQGPYLKRFQPRAKGRAYLILKPTCSITIKMKSHDTSKRSRPPIKLGTH